MSNKNILNKKLSGTLSALDKLTQQLRETKDYSEKSELVFMLRELVIEQIDGKNQENENISYSTNTSR